MKASALRWLEEIEVLGQWRQRFELWRWSVRHHPLTPASCWPTRGSRRSGRLTISSGSGAESQKKTAHAAEQERPDVAAARATWRNEQPGLTERLVFLARPAADRTWPGVMAGHRAANGWWRPSPWPLEDNHVHCRPASRRITAPCVFDGPINGASFLAWDPASPGPDPVRGTSSSWTTSPPTRRRRTRGHWCGRRNPAHLPPYSPDLNPIEQVFAKLKATPQGRRRTVDALAGIGNALDEFSPTACRYLVNAGYSV